MKYFRFLVCFILIFLFSVQPNAYAKRPIKDYVNLVQPMYIPLTADVGTVMVKFQKQSDLPNFLGNADRFGRKVDKGKKELLYLGTNKQGFIKIKIRDVSVSTNENAVNRMKPSYRYYNYSCGSVSGYTLKSQKYYRKEGKPDEATLEYDYKSNNNMIEFGGKKVKVIEVTPLNVKYMIMNTTDML